MISGSFFRWFCYLGRFIGSFGYCLERRCGFGYGVGYFEGVWESWVYRGRGDGGAVGGGWVFGSMVFVFEVLIRVLV